MTNAEVSAEFLDDDDAAVSTDVVDPDTAAEVRASLSLRDADRIEAFVRSKIAGRVRECGFAMNCEVLADLIESGCL